MGRKIIGRQQKALNQLFAIWMLTCEPKVIWLVLGLTVHIFSRNFVKLLAILTLHGRFSECIILLWWHSVEHFLKCVFTWSSSLSIPSRLMELFLWAWFWDMERERRVSVVAVRSAAFSWTGRCGMTFSNMRYHGCVKSAVFRWTAGQPIILRHGSSILCPLHAHQGWRRAQSDGLFQLELQENN